MPLENHTLELVVQYDNLFLVRKPSGDDVGRCTSDKITLTPIPYCAAVAISMAVIENEASPSISTTIFSGEATLAPIEAGSPKPIVCNAKSESAKHARAVEKEEDARRGLQTRSTSEGDGTCSAERPTSGAAQRRSR